MDGKTGKELIQEVANDLTVRINNCWSGCEKAGITNPEALPGLVEVVRRVHKLTGYADLEEALTAVGVEG